jgi:hypothetical protein
MKKGIITTLILAFVAFTFSQAQESYSSFLKANSTGKSIEQLSMDIKSSLESRNFEVIGQYNPMQSEDLLVICFTRKDLQTASLSFPESGALASTLKIGLQKTASGVEISLQNPMYMFYAYFRDEISKKVSVLKAIDQDAKLCLTDLYGPLTPFGGSLEAEKLMKYHYKMMMPYFDDPDELETYSSFEEGLRYIQDKLAKSDQVSKVYEQIFPDKKVAVFGIGLLNKEKGEAKFLPIIGENHLAAMPYEIILQGKEVTMLAGKYRIALYWPELTMGTFMKIMSTPGDIEDMLSEITKQ